MSSGLDVDTDADTDVFVKFITHWFAKFWCLKILRKALSTASKIVGVLHRKAYTVARTPSDIGWILSAEMAEKFTQILSFNKDDRREGGNICQAEWHKLS